MGLLPVDQPGVEGLLKSKVAPGGGGGSDGDSGGDGGGDGGAGCAQISNPPPVTEESLCHSISSLAAMITPSGPVVPQYRLPPTSNQSNRHPYIGASTWNELTCSVSVTSARMVHRSLLP